MSSSSSSSSSSGPSAPPSSPTQKSVYDLVVGDVVLANISYRHSVQPTPLLIIAELTRVLDRPGKSFLGVEFFSKLPVEGKEDAADHAIRVEKAKTTAHSDLWALNQLNTPERFFVVPNFVHQMNTRDFIGYLCHVDSHYPIGCLLIFLNLVREVRHRLTRTPQMPPGFAPVHLPLVGAIIPAHHPNTYRPAIVLEQMEQYTTALVLAITTEEPVQTGGIPVSPADFHQHTPIVHHNSWLSPVGVFTIVNNGENNEKFVMPRGELVNTNVGVTCLDFLIKVLTTTLEDLDIVIPPPPADPNNNNDTDPNNNNNNSSSGVDIVKGKGKN